MGLMAHYIAFLPLVWPPLRKEQLPHSSSQEINVRCYKRKGEPAALNDAFRGSKRTWHLSDTSEMPSICPSLRDWLCCVVISSANFLNLRKDWACFCALSAQQNYGLIIIGFKSCPYEFSWWLILRITCWKSYSWIKIISEKHSFSSVHLWSPWQNEHF